MPQIHDLNPVMDNNFITVNCIEKKKRGRELHNFFKYVLNYFEHNVDNTMVVKADGWKGGISPPPVSPPLLPVPAIQHNKFNFRSGCPQGVRGGGPR